MFTMQEPNPNSYSMPEEVNDFSMTDEQKRQMMAKLLQGGAQQKSAQTQYENGWAVPQSGASDISSLVSTLGSAYMRGGMGGGA